MALCMSTILFAYFVSTVLAQEIKPPVIYGSDGRRDYYQISGRDLQSVAKRGVALVAKGDLVHHTDGGYQLKTKVYGRAFNLCSSEKYFAQPTASFCSGLLIGPDVILTAGHCIKDQKNCDETLAVFDFRMSSIGDHPTELPESSVYSCKKILYAVENRNADFAVFQLDRKVNRAPVSVADYLTASPGQHLVVIGHPSGLPQKITVGGRVRQNLTHYFKASLDTYENNSGSPVFESSSLRFVGVLTGGEEDFVKKEGATCLVSKVCAEDSCRGEDVMKAKPIFDVLRNL